MTRLPVACLETAETGSVRRAFWGKSLSAHKGWQDPAGWDDKMDSIEICSQGHQENAYCVWTPGLINPSVRLRCLHHSTDGAHVSLVPT